MEWNCLSIHKLQMGQRCFSTRLSSATIITQYPVFHCNSIKIVYFFLGPLQNRPCIVFSFSLNKLLNGQSNRWLFEMSCLTVISGGGGGGDWERGRYFNSVVPVAKTKWNLHMQCCKRKHHKKAPEMQFTWVRWNFIAISHRMRTSIIQWLTHIIST